MQMKSLRTAGLDDYDPTIEDSYGSDLLMECCASSELPTAMV